MKSDNIKKGIQRAPHRSLLRACGLGDNDFDKPFIGIANSFTEIVPGHIHLRELVEFVKEGIIAAGGIPFEFNTMAICDGISMNHEGMKYSLPSREIIAATVESMAKGHSFDGLVLMPSCDKVVPGMLMGAARVDVPTIVVTGGPMAAGQYKGKNADLITVFEAVGQESAGKISEEEVYEIEKCACPGAGSCSGLFTANTMACVTETLGLSLPFCATTHAADKANEKMAYNSGKQIIKLVERFGLDNKKLKEIMSLNVSEININEYGRFDELKNSVDKEKAKAYFEEVEGCKLSIPKVNIKVHNLLKDFILSGGYDSEGNK